MVSVNTAPLHFKQLNKSLGGKTLLKDVNLSIHRGTFNLLRGKNGAGKTTLLRIIAGLEKPNSALISFGETYKSWPKSKQALRQASVYLHQQPYMLDTTVKKNLAYTLSHQSLTTSQKSKLIDSAIDLAHINDIIHCHAKTLSGGEQQRVALARAWLRNPRIMLLDEPTANMDSDSRKRTIDLLSQLKDQGLAIIIATHDPTQFNSLTHTLYTLKDGSLTSSCGVSSLNIVHSTEAA